MCFNICLGGFYSYLLVFIHADLLIHSYKDVL